MRFTIDSNVLIYALAGESPHKQSFARDLLIRSMTADAFLTAQVLGEFINVVRRKFPAFIEEAIEQASRLSELFLVVNTTPQDVLNGAAFAHRHRLQLWDSIIWQAARTGGAAVFLSEDLQDGLSLEGMTVLNPFEPANADRIRLLFDQPRS